VILAGDLNAEPNESSPTKLVDEGYIDVLAEGGDATCEEAGDPGCTNSALPLGNNPENNADRRIDYIFYLPGEVMTLEISSAQLFNNEPFEIEGGDLLWASDHIGVHAVLEVLGGIETSANHW
jgi:endonuclease/exonuclease/phosphatase family metal-dependent hydrolase